MNQKGKSFIQPKWIIFFSAILATLHNFIVMNFMNPISSYLIADFNLSATLLSFLSSTFFLISFLLVIPAGIIIDRFSIRKILLTGMLLNILSLFIFAWATSYTGLLMSRVLGGIANALVYLPCIKLAANWFFKRELALACGFILSMAFLGAMIAQTPMLILTQYLDSYRLAISCFAILGFFFWLLIFWKVYDSPLHMENRLLKREQNLKQKKSSSIIDDFLLVVKNHNNWLCALYTSLLNSPLFILGALWGNLYLISSHNLTAVESSWVNISLFFGVILGAPILGWFSDYCQKRISFMAIGSTISFILILIIIYNLLSFAALLLLFFILGFLVSIQNLSYSLIIEKNPKELVASASSIISLFLIGSGFIFQPLFGSLLGLSARDSAPYSPSAFHSAMLIIPVAFFFSFITILLMKILDFKK